MTQPTDHPQDAEPTQTDAVTDTPDNIPQSEEGKAAEAEEAEDVSDDSDAPDDMPPVPEETINVPPDGDNREVGGEG